MNETVHPRPLGDFDDPWRRLPWVTLVALSIWIGLLAAFAFLLRHTEPRPAELKPLEARIVELPSEVGGLAGGGGQPARVAARPARAKVAPHVPRVVQRKKVEQAPLPVLPNGTATSPAAAPTRAPSGAAGGGAREDSNQAGESAGVEGTGSGAGPGGLGSDHLGAHAIYAPLPEIPDELRENAIQTVAVAHFKVSYDGEVIVSLATRTENPRLNEILLDTLKQWRFFPAMKNGVAIDSEFDLKIPISVQ